MSRTLQTVTAVLEELAPLAWAEEWDNVGLLVDPGRRNVGRILLTIDLTTAVMAEARRRSASMIVAYHPPIFSPLRRLSVGEPLHRSLLECAQERIALYSPHTALDAAASGVTDWLADGLGPGERQPLSRGVQHAGAPPEVGLGRVVELARPVALATVVRRVREHLRLPRLRTAIPGDRAADRRPVRRVAVCPGAGGSVVALAGTAADLYLTGEMRHHDVLAAVERGVSVILSEHTHTERGYLPRLAARLRRTLGRGVEVVVSRADREPIR